MSARRWWLVLIAVVVTTSAAAALVLPKPDEFQSKATFIVRPNGSTGGDEIRAIDTLIRGGSINATYASIARSRLIRDRARELMADGLDLSDLRVKSEVVTGTNLLSITVRSKDPELAHDFLQVVSSETVEYVALVDDAYRLEPLDPPSVPTTPVDARKSLTIGLGLFFGLALGVGLALFADYLRTPTAAADAQGAGPDPKDNPRTRVNGTDERAADQVARSDAGTHREVVSLHWPERTARYIHDPRSKSR